MPTIARAQTVDRAQLLTWGQETQQQIESTLGLSGPLYAETAHTGGSQSGGSSGYAFAWPLSTQFQVLNSLTRQDPVTYTPILRAFSDSFHTNFYSSSGGYRCCKTGGDRFYDDNAHIAVALAQAYEITGDPIYLTRARSTYTFLITGEAPGQNGGSYWSVADHTFLDSAAALQGARAGAMLYSATGESNFLTNAQSRYNWAKTTTQLASGTFYEKKFLTGPKAGQVGDYDLVNFAGFGISANNELFDATGDLAYLTEARRIANTSLTRYFDSATGRINDEGYWAFELADSLVHLYERDGDVRWLNAVNRALVWLHANKRDPAGHYGTFWGRNGAQTTTLSEWSLNEQASVAQAYLHTGLSELPSVRGDFNGDRVVDAADYTIWRDNQGRQVYLPNSNGLALPVGGAQYSLWRTYFGSAPLAEVTATPVNEPASMGLVLVLIGARLRQRAGVRKHPE